MKVDSLGNGESQLYSLPSLIFSKFLNSTRTGSAHTQAGISIATFLSSMLVSVAYFFLQLILFTILRSKLRCIYRTNMACGSAEGTSSTTESKKFVKRFLSWIPTVIFSRTERYRSKVGLDAYFFLRFLQMLSIFFLTLSLINISILIPIHYHSSMNNVTDEPPPWLDRMNVSSLVAQNSSKLVFHMILGVFVVVWFHAFLIRELQYIFEVTLPAQVDTTSILLIERVPQKLVGDCAKITSHMEKLVSKCILDVKFLPKNSEKLRKLYKRILEAEEKVETITMKIILCKFFSNVSERNNESYLSQTGAQKIHLQVNKLLFFLKTWDKSLYAIQNNKESNKNRLRWFTRRSSSASSDSNSYLSLERATLRYEKIVGEWSQYCNELQNWENAGCDPGNRTLNSEIYLDKVLIKFSSMNEARAVADLLLNGSDNEWKHVHIISDLKDIVWRNIQSSNPTIIQLRSALANLLGTLIIIGYIIPVAFVGLISQIPYLASLAAFQTESNESRGSKFFRDIMAGIVPVVTLIFLTECVPFIFWWLSYLRCKKTNGEMQADTQSWFFTFLFVHVFLVVTISSSLSIVVEKIVNSPVSIPTMLAHDLPKSSNFFCSFILVRGLAYSGGNLLQIKQLLLEVYYRLTIYPPHRRIKRMKNMPDIQWCSVYPIFSVLGCISIVYSLICPLILPLSCIAFSLVMFSFKYLYEFQYNREKCSGTEGKLYPSSLMQMYAGVYCMEFCMIGLFALGNCFKLCLCMIVTSGLTIVAHVKIYRYYHSKLYKFNFGQYYQKNGNSCAFHESISRNIDIPFAGGTHKPEIWVPACIDGFIDAETDYLNKSFNLRLKASRFRISPTGDIVY